MTETSVSTKKKIITTIALAISLEIARVAYLIIKFNLTVLSAPVSGLIPVAAMCVFLYRRQYWARYIVGFYFLFYGFLIFLSGFAMLMQGKLLGFLPALIGIGMGCVVKTLLMNREVAAYFKSDSKKLFVILGTTFSAIIFVGIIFILNLTVFLQKAADEIDFGTIKNSVYQNEYFGLSVALPPEWSALDQEARQKMFEIGSEMVAGDDMNLKALVKASEMTSVFLFTVYKHPLGMPVPYNPNIACVAELVRFMPGIKRGEDYLFHSKKLLESSQMEFSFPKEMSTESLGGQEFGVMHVEMSMAGMTVRQKYYAAIMKGYALAFVVSFSTDEEESSLQEILKTVTFK